MREETLYYAEGNPFPYLSKSAAEEWERKDAERRKHWLENTADARYDQLLQELKNCQYIPPGTITTCLSLIHISEPTRPRFGSRMPSSA